MDRMVYVMMSGAKETMLAMANNSHNLANANTSGFLEDLNQFRSMPVFGQGHPTRVYAQGERHGTNFQPGAMQNTGRDLDVAVKGQGWIAVQALDGGEAYSRRGDLQIDANGLLTNGVGQPVIGNGGPIALPPLEKLEIGEDGTISIRPLGQGASELAVVDRIKLVNPAQNRLTKGEDGLMRLKDGSVADADSKMELRKGHLEGSNVNIIESMVKMIELARHFEFQVKLMKTAEELDTATASVMRQA